MDSQETALIENPHLDKKGADLDRQRFRMLGEIAEELSGEIIFPTTFDSAALLRRTLRDPSVPAERIITVLGIDPLVSARILGLANSAGLNPEGQEICSLGLAVERIGLETVRILGLSIATKQLILAREVVLFQELAAGLWEHSLHTASAAFVVAKRMAVGISPNDALTAGMIHELGAFYMISRAAKYEELLVRPNTARYLVARWHESVGHSVALALGVPAIVADAILDHDQPRPIPLKPKTLAEVIYVASLIAGGKTEWLHLPDQFVEGEFQKLVAISALLQGEINTYAASWRASLSNW